MNWQKSELYSSNNLFIQKNGQDSLWNLMKFSVLVTGSRLLQEIHQKTYHTSSIPFYTKLAKNYKSLRITRKYSQTSTHIQDGPKLDLFFGKGLLFEKGASN